MEIRIDGADEFDSLGRRFEDAGSGGGLRGEMADRIRRSVHPLPDALRGSARRVLPERGGLAARVAASALTVTAQESGSQVHVRVEARGAYNLARLDAGEVRHPVYGRRPLVTQRNFPAGWFSRPVEKAVTDVREAADDALRAVAEQITKG